MGKVKTELKTKLRQNKGKNLDLTFFSLVLEDVDNNFFYSVNNILII